MNSDGFTRVAIPWDKAWEWGNNDVQRWCDQFCEGNYIAQHQWCVDSVKRVLVSFEKESDATLFAVKWL